MGSLRQGPQEVAWPVTCSPAPAPPATALKMNVNLRELYLADNKLNGLQDSAQLGNLLKFNCSLQILDLRNNHVLDSGVWGSPSACSVPGPGIHGAGGMDVAKVAPGLGQGSPAWGAEGILDHRTAGRAAGGVVRCGASHCDLQRA